MKMRRNDREITDTNEILSMLRASRILRIAYLDEEGMTIVPVTPAVERVGDRFVLYAHGAADGRKFRAFSRSPRVTFETESNLAPNINHGNAQSNSWRFDTVIGHADASVVTDNAEKIRILNLLLAAHGTQARVMPSDAIDHVAVYRFDVADLAAKRHL